MPLTVGGGVRTVEDIKTLLRVAAPTRSRSTAAAVAGASSSRRRPRNSANSALLWRSMPRKYRRRAKRRREIFTHGGRNPTRVGCCCLCQRRCGVGSRRESRRHRWTATAPKKAYDLPLTHAIADAVTVPVIASGGVGALSSLPRTPRRTRHRGAGGSIFHFGEHSVLCEAKAYMAKAGLPMRLDPCNSFPAAEEAVMRNADRFGKTGARACPAARRNSCTRTLIDKGVAHCAKKLGEEAIETGLAAVQEDKGRLIAEAADLRLNLSVGYCSKRAVSRWQRSRPRLGEKRTAQTGHEEKASRPTCK